jgi:hypothetical protein
MFSNRQRHAAAGAGAAVSDDTSAREEAAALAEEIAARSDGKGKGERSPGVQRFWMLVTAGLVFLVVFFAPMSWYAPPRPPFLPSTPLLAISLRRLIFLRCHRQRTVAASTRSEVES